MKETIKRFMEIYFSEPESILQAQPQLNLWKEINYQANENGHKQSGQAIIFAIHKTVDIINGEWPVKSDKILLMYEGNIYLLKDLTTVRDDEIKFPKGNLYFKVTPVMASFGYILSDKCTCRGIKQATEIIVKKENWRPIRLHLMVETLPSGVFPQKIRESLVGEEFRLEISNFQPNRSYKRKDGAIMISTSCVSKTLREAGKIEAADYYQRLSDTQVEFPLNCYRLI